MNDDIIEKSWYGAVMILECNNCAGKENCTIQDLVNCMKAYEEWLEENAI